MQLAAKHDWSKTHCLFAIAVERKRRVNRHCINLLIISVFSTRQYPTSASGSMPGTSAPHAWSAVAEPFGYDHAGTICHDSPNLSFSQPHMLSSPPPLVRGIPVVIHFLLIFAVYKKRNRFCKLEHRPRIEHVHRQPVDLDRSRHDLVGRKGLPCPTF